MSRAQNLKLSRKWHLLLVWPAMLSVLIYVLSSLAHPVAGWVGPEKQRFKAPSFQVGGKAVNSIASIIQRHQLTSAQIAKLVPYDNQILLQITQGSGPNLIRRYFSTDSYNELPEQDAKQAIWLAQQYVIGNPKVKFVEYINEFNETYPESNRLLPVYKIHYQGASHLTAVVHTESLALVSLNNDAKRFIKSVFRMFHTFDWLSEYEALRLTVIGFLLLVMLMMSVTGFYFLLVMKRKRVIKKAQRRWHQRLSYVLVLPLFLFSVSGFYHLFQASFYSPKELVVSQTQLNLSQWQKPIVITKEIAGLSLSQVSLVQSDGPLYRLQVVKKGRHGHGMPMQKVAAQKRVHFLNAHTGQALEYSDSVLIKEALAKRFSLDKTNLANSTMLHAFEQGYSFKNKRLPVWRIELQDEGNHHVFIDPVTQTLLASNNPVTRLEGYSFSYLHMWGFLKPLVGHLGRDVTFTIVLVLIFALGLLGLLVHLKAKRRVKGAAGVLQRV